MKVKDLLRFIIGFTWINMKNGFVFMAIALRGYSLFNCLEIQFAMFGKPTAWAFTVIIELAALLILYLLIKQNDWKFFLGFVGYGLFAFGLIMLNDASLALKNKNQSAESETLVLRQFENLKKSQESQYDKLILLRLDNIDENDNFLDMDIPQWKRDYYDRRNETHRTKIKEYETEKLEYLAGLPKDIRDIKKYMTSRSSITSKIDDNGEKVLLRVYGLNTLDNALRESWGIEGVEAKKLYRLIMAIVIELLIFGFAIIPKISKSQNIKSQKVSQNTETKRKSQSVNGRRKINSIEDLRQSILSQLKSTGKMPYKRKYNRKWHNDFDEIKEELENKKLLEVIK